MKTSPLRLAHTLGTSNHLVLLHTHPRKTHSCTNSYHICCYNFDLLPIIHKITQPSLDTPDLPTQHRAPLELDTTYLSLIPIPFPSSLHRTVLYSNGISRPTCRIATAVMLLTQITPSYSPNFGLGVVMLYEAVWKSQWGRRNKRTQTDALTSLSWTLLLFFFSYDFVRNCMVFSFFFFGSNSLAGLYNRNSPFNSPAFFLGRAFLSFSHIAGRHCLLSLAHPAATPAAASVPSFRPPETSSLTHRGRLCKE